MSDIAYANEDARLTTTSTVDEEVGKVIENIDMLAAVIEKLEGRLVTVMNNHPRPVRDETTVKEPEFAKGNSIIVTQLQRMSDSVLGQRDRIRMIIDRLDI